MAKTIMASDGFEALIIKRHSLEKLYYFRRYIQQFTTALKPKPITKSSKFRGFEERNYIDLFCGTGICVLSDTKEEVDGSSLLALKTNYPFSNYYFIDVQTDYISALEARSNLILGSQNLSKKFLSGDCNNKIDDAINNINKNYSINLAIIDGFGIECHWSTIEILASCKRMDLLILFPQGMSINRNLSYWSATQSNLLDLFFGTDKWRRIYEQSNCVASLCIRPFLDLYELNLSKLGYSGNNQVREVLIKSKKGGKLYYLILASRDPLGNQFWKQATEKTINGQRRFNGF